MASGDRGCSSRSSGPDHDLLTGMPGALGLMASPSRVGWIGGPASERAETGAGLDATLARVEAQRAPDRWPMIAATDFLARSFAWRLPGLPAVRGLALAGLELATPLKVAIAKRMMFGG